MPPSLHTHLSRRYFLEHNQPIVSKNMCQKGALARQAARISESDRHRVGKKRIIFTRRSKDFVASDRFVAGIHPFKRSNSAVYSGPGQPARTISHPPTPFIDPHSQIGGGLVPLLHPMALELQIGQSCPPPAPLAGGSNAARCRGAPANPKGVTVDTVFKERMTWLPKSL
jgi:hypothetical protein